MVGRGRSQARGTQVRHQIMLLLTKREAHSHTPPTVREIAKTIGRSPATVHRHIEILTELGMLERRTPGLARTIRLRHEGKS